MKISERAFQRIFSCKSWLRYSRERALLSLPALRAQIPQVRRGEGWRRVFAGLESGDLVTLDPASGAFTSNTRLGARVRCMLHAADGAPGSAPQVFAGLSNRLVGLDLTSGEVSSNTYLRTYAVHCLLQVGQRVFAGLHNGSRR